MRLKTNHNNAHTDPVGFVILTSVALGAFMLLLAVVWTLDGLSYRRALPGLRAEAQSSPTSAVESAATTATNVDPKRLRQTVNAVRRLNALPGAGGGEIVAGLNRFETMLPRQARLTRLQYQANTRRWALVIEAVDAGVLAAFARALEGETGLNVMVQSQTRDERKPGGVTRMELWVSE